MSGPDDAAASPVAWWRHPVALAVVHLQRAAFGVLAVLPVALWVASVLGAHAGVDATLFDEGGLLLADVLGALRGARDAFGAVAIVLLGLGVLVGIATTSALLDAMARPGRRPVHERGADALVTVPPLLFAAIATLIAQIAVALGIGGGGVALARALGGDPRTTDLASLAALGLAALVASLLAAWLDLVRAGVAGLRLGLADAVAVALGAARARPLHLLGAHLMRAVTALALLGSASLLGIRIGMRDSGDATLTQGVLEAALIAATCLRASWLGVALQAAREARVGTALPDDLVSSKKSPTRSGDAAIGPR